MPYVAPVDMQQRDTLLAHAANVYKKHATPGSYSTFEEADDRPNLSHSADDTSRGQPARFQLATPRFQDPETHWHDQFAGKLRIQENMVACTGLPTDPIPELLKLLRDAITSRERCATQYAWYAVKRFAGKPQLGLTGVALTVDLIHFLLFCAELPDLFCVIVHQHNKGAHWHAGLGINVLRQDQGELVPMVAALMEAVHYVKRSTQHTHADAGFVEHVKAHKKERERWEGHGYAPADAWWRSEVGAPPGDGNDTWWHRALTLLIPALPKRPSRICRYQNAAMRPITTSLLVRAALCSELSTAAFELLVTNCEFCDSVVSIALQAVLYRGNVRGPTVVRLASVLYHLLWHARSTPVHDPPRQTWSLRYLEFAWQELLVQAACQQVVSLHSTRAKRAMVDFDYVAGVKSYGEDGGIYSAAHYEELAQCFFSAHDADMSRKGDDEAIAKLCYRAMKVAIQACHQKTYLVNALLQHASARSFLSRYFNAPRFLVTILTWHVGCWDACVMTAFKDYHRHGDAEKKARWNESVCVTMKYLVENRIRHGVDALLDALGEVGLPPELMTSEALVRFVRFLCCTSTRVNDLHAGQPPEGHFRICWEALGMYLTTGGPSRWDPEVLQAGLREGALHNSGVAVEVFLSAPYNVQPPSEDHFSLAVLEALLAPGERAVLATGEQFGKRQKRVAVAE